MLPSTSSREAFFACPPFPPWNLLSFAVESTLSSSCSRSYPPLFRQGAALAHLDSNPMIWYSGLTALFLFLLARAAPAFLLQGFTGFGSTNKSAISLLFSSCLTRSVLQLLFLFTRHSVLFSIFPLIPNSVADLAGTVFSLLLYQTTMGPWTLVSPRKQCGR